MAISNLLRSLRVVSGKKRSIQSSVCIPRYFDPFPFPGKDIGRLRNLVRPAARGFTAAAEFRILEGYPVSWWAIPAKEIRMTETTKKAKAPAKPRKTAVKKTTGPVEVPAASPSHEEISRLAEKFWAERGWQEGHAEQDWLRAERELRGMAS
jgi:hypothetical protein